MGESIEEATITKWFVKPGDKVVEDDVLLEIATDKVDSEIPSPVEGVVKKLLFEQDATVAVGTVIAVIDMDGDDGSAGESETEEDLDAESSEVIEDKAEDRPVISTKSQSGRFYSPLVKKIASEENISQEDLYTIEGSGANGRVRKQDVMAFIASRSSTPDSVPERPQKDHT